MTGAFKHYAFCGRVRGMVSEIKKCFLYLKSVNGVVWNLRVTRRFNIGYG